MDWSKLRECQGRLLGTFFPLAPFVFIFSQVVYSIAISFHPTLFTSLPQTWPRLNQSFETLYTFFYIGNSVG